MKHAQYLKLPKWQKRWLYAVLLLLWTTGVVYWWAAEFWQVQATFGPEASPWQARLLHAHGILATPALLIIGSLMVVHWARGWRRELGRVPGLSMLLVMTLLVGTGTVLWYAADESWRNAASFLHEWLGVALPILLTGHIAWARHQIRS